MNLSELHKAYKETLREERLEKMYGGGGKKGEKEDSKKEEIDLLPYVSRVRHGTLCPLTKNCSEFTTTEYANIVGKQRNEIEGEVATDAWYKRSKILKQGGKDLWKKGRDKAPIGFVNFKIGDFVTLGNSWRNPSMPPRGQRSREGYEQEDYGRHSGIIVGKNKNGIPIVRHNVNGQIREEPLGDIRNYEVLSAFRAGSSDKYINEKNKNLQFIHRRNKILDKFEKGEYPDVSFSIANNLFDDMYNEYVENRADIAAAYAVEPEQLDEIFKNLVGIAAQESYLDNEIAPTILKSIGNTTKELTPNWANRLGKHLNNFRKSLFQDDTYEINDDIQDWERQIVIDNLVSQGLPLEEAVDQVYSNLGVSSSKSQVTDKSRGPFKQKGPSEYWKKHYGGQEFGAVEAIKKENWGKEWDDNNLNYLKNAIGLYLENYEKAENLYEGDDSDFHHQVAILAHNAPATKAFSKEFTDYFIKGIGNPFPEESNSHYNVNTKNFRDNLIVEDGEDREMTLYTPSHEELRQPREIPEYAYGGPVGGCGGPGQPPCPDFDMTLPLENIMSQPISTEDKMKVLSHVNDLGGNFETSSTEELSPEEQNQLAMQQSLKQARTELAEDRVFEDMQKAYKHPLGQPGMFSPFGVEDLVLSGATRGARILANRLTRGATNKVVNLPSLTPIEKMSASDLDRILESATPIPSVYKDGKKVVDNLELSRYAGDYLKHTLDEPSMQMRRALDAEYGSTFYDDARRYDELFDVNAKIGGNDMVYIMSDKDYKETLKNLSKTHGLDDFGGMSYPHRTSEQIIKNYVNKSTSHGTPSKDINFTPHTAITRSAILKRPLEKVKGIVEHEVAHGLNFNGHSFSPKLEKEIESFFKDDIMDLATDNSTIDALNRLEANRDYYTRPTEVFSYLVTDLKRTLKEAGTIKEFNSKITLKDVENNPVWKVYKPFIRKGKEKDLIGLINKVPYSIVGAAAVLGGAKQGDEED